VSYSDFPSAHDDYLHS